MAESHIAAELNVGTARANSTAQHSRKCACHGRRMQQYLDTFPNFHCCMLTGIPIGNVFLFFCNFNTFCLTSSVRAPARMVFCPATGRVPTRLGINMSIFNEPRRCSLCRAHTACVECSITASLLLFLVIVRTRNTKRRQMKTSADCHRNLCCK